MVKKKTKTKKVAKSENIGKKTSKKQIQKKKSQTKKTNKKVKQKSQTKDEKENKKNFPKIKIKKDQDIAMDFATKAYERFNKLIKSIILFGSVAKKTTSSGSDIDIIIVIDDVSIFWDQELIAWYREELDKILRQNPYNKNIHVNTIKLSTWWEDLIRGDPVVINVLRYGESLIDFGGFFEPLKVLLLKGKIKSTPEAIYSCLKRAPQHLLRSRTAELNAVEGLYWAMVDSSHAALIAEDMLPPSPEHIPAKLRETFANKGKLKSKYIDWYKDLLLLHKKIAHGEISDLKGVEIDLWQSRTEEFMRVMARLVDNSIGTGKK